LNKPLNVAPLNVGFTSRQGISPTTMAAAKTMLTTIKAGITLRIAFPA